MTNCTFVNKEGEERRELGSGVVGSAPR